jgi:hypothetical protein
LRCIRDHCGVADITKVLLLPDWHPDRTVAGAPEASNPTTCTPKAVKRLLPASEGVRRVA